MSKKFYTSIARYYDLIFKAAPVQAEFIDAHILGGCAGKSALEIGCGTGNLCRQLAQKFDHVAALDLDEEMLEIARQKATSSNRKIDFIRVDMLDFGQHFVTQTFDAVICFGNTLVHLDSPGQFEIFFQQARQRLQSGGRLFVQIVNYDRALRQKLPQLPVIENEQIRFERYYSYNAERNKITFKTVLTLKEEARQIENEVELYPLLKNEMEAMLQSAGFRKNSFYGAFSGEPWHAESMPLISVSAVS